MAASTLLENMRVGCSDDRYCIALSHQKIAPQDQSVAVAVCADAALACSTFLVASARWNASAGAAAAMFRLSEARLALTRCITYRGDSGI